MTDGSGSASLFRREVAAHRSERLHGSVSIATPLAWQAIGFLLLIALAIALGFLLVASYARVETVGGVVALDRGVATIIPSRSGVVASIDVREGQAVRAGETLVRVRAEEDMLGGDTAPIRMRAALEEQDASLTEQIGLLKEAADAERARLDEQVLGLEGEIESLNQQIGDQERLVAAAEAEAASVRQIATNGFVSQRELEQREAALLQRRQQLAALQSDRSARRASIAEARRAVAQAGASAQAQIAAVNSTRAELEQRLAEIELAQGYVLTAPVDGIVTALTVRLGQRASPEQAMMLVVPEDAEPRVELSVPSVAAGFVAPDQDVRIAVDAFPYQRFGTLSARIVDVSSAAISQQTPQGPMPVYLVTASLDRSVVRAFGRDQPLLPGMTLTARIVTERRSLLEWLFEPIFAVSNR